MKHYFYSDGEKQKGPFTLEQLKNENIDKETLVWFEGLKDWKPVKEIKELEYILQLSPPSIPRAETESNTINIESEKVNEDSTTDSDNMENNEKLKGLSGWLILIGIAIVVTPIRLLVTTVPVFQPIFTDGTWEALTTVGSEAYNPLWGPILIGEILYNLCMVIASTYLIYLFFSKHHRFPSFYILIVVISLIFIPLDAWLVSFVMHRELFFDPNTAKEFVRIFIGGLIWVPYMLKSKRVKATFVEKIPDNAIE